MELASVRDVSYTRLVLLKCGASGVEHVATPHIHPPFQDSSEVVLLNGSNEHIITKQALGAHFAAEGSSLVRTQVRGEGQGGGREGEEKEGGGKVAVGIPPQLWADAGMCVQVRAGRGVLNRCWLLGELGYRVLEITSRWPVAWARNSQNSHLFSNLFFT